ncbi:DUF882 domain-containing protein [Rhizobium oryzicola]
MKQLASFALLAVIAASTVSLPAGPATAAGETRSLKLYFVHTGERAVITFKRNGRYDASGLQQLNQFLRDWRRNEPTRMDPRLFDLVWEVYRRSGATDYIHVVSAYRSPTTNGMLRSRTKGVAEHSQHMLGKAMDYFIPGVKLADLRAIGMKMQVGGVGFYPTSGSPFVHMDVGGVRAWPRMSREELVRLFPNGNTMHLPADGKPLPGYEQAVADYKRRVGADSIQIASTAGGAPSVSRKKPTNLMAMLFGNSGDEDEDAEAISAPDNVPARPSAPVRTAPVADTPAQAPVAVASAQPVKPPQPAAELQVASAPVPLSRPAFREDAAPAGGLATALYSPPKNTAQEAFLAALPATPVTPLARPTQDKDFEDLANYSIPVPTLLGPRGLKGDAEGSGVQTASLDKSSPVDFAASAVPVPVHRPEAVAEAVAAAPVASKALVEPGSDKKTLTPELVAELAKSADDAPVLAPQAKPVQQAAQPQPTQPVQVAMANARSDEGRGRDMMFGDGFDAPKPAAAPVPKPAPASAATSGKVVKGGAVSKLGGRPANPGTQVLTRDMIAQWALDKNHAAPTASTKAPRVVNRTLTADTSVAYGGGFKPVTTAVSIDENRFQ